MSGRLLKRAADGYPIGADGVMREAYGPIPDAPYGFVNPSMGAIGTPDIPVTVHGWQWSTTFSRWSALVTFPNDWHGFTYPWPYPRYAKGEFQ